jgi:cytochrome c biogenesis protein CcdA
MEFMIEEYEKKRRKQVSFMRSMLDYTMGIVIIILGFILIFHQQLKMAINERYSPTIVRVLGVIFVLYGAWRIYRGYKKNYFQ